MHLATYFEVKKGEDGCDVSCRMKVMEALVRKPISCCSLMCYVDYNKKTARYEYKEKKIKDLREK